MRRSPAPAWLAVLVFLCASVFSCASSRVHPVASQDAAAASEHVMKPVVVGSDMGDTLVGDNRIAVQFKIGSRSTDLVFVAQNSRSVSARLNH